MLREVIFPWESRYYFGDALRNKGSKWIFKLNEMDGTKGLYLVLAVFNMQSKLCPHDNRVLVQFFPLIRMEKEDE